MTPNVCPCSAPLSSTLNSFQHCAMSISFYYSSDWNQQLTLVPLPWRRRRSTLFIPYKEMSFPTLLCFTHTGEDIHAQIQRIYTCTHNHMQIVEVTEQRRCQVPCSWAPRQWPWRWTGTSPAISSLNYFFCPIRTWTGDSLVPRPSPYKLSHCQTSAWFNIQWFFVFLLKEVEGVHGLYCRLSNEWST